MRGGPKCPKWAIPDTPTPAPGEAGNPRCGIAPPPSRGHYCSVYREALGKGLPESHLVAVGLSLCVCPGYVIYRIRVRRGGRKRPVPKGATYGKPVHHGVNQLKFARSLQSVAEVRGSGYWLSWQPVRGCGLEEMRTTVEFDWAQGGAWRCLYLTLAKSNYHQNSHYCLVLRFILRRFLF